MSYLRAGVLIHQLRKQRGITAIELGRLVHMSQSKISRLETGFYKKPSRRDIESILTALQVSEDERNEVLRQLETKSALPLVIKRDVENTVQNQRHLLKWYRQAKNVRFYSEGLLPGLLQTPAYMDAVFKLMGVDEKARTLASKQRMLGQDALWNRSCNFLFVLGHFSLYGAPAGAAAQLAQLGRLEQMASLPNIQLGVIPLEAGMQLSGFASLNIIDAKVVSIEAGAEVDITSDAQEVQAYNGLFEQLLEHAVRGEQALQLIRRAQVHFGNKLNA